MRDFEKKIYGFINEYSMTKEGERIIVGLSGGADSVCLLYVLKKLGMLPVAVHINHMIRENEADMDEKFCKNLCEKLTIPFKAYHKDIKALAAAEKMTVEEAGRRFRYECFENERKEYGADKIAVAHNKNDLAETVIFNMTRGSGLNGLAGIKPVRDNIIRPLLDVKRNEIEAYLKELGQDFRTDSTNLSKDYDRNKIRHIVIPTLLELNAGAIEHICEAAKDSEESYNYIKEISDLGLSKCLKEENADGSIVLDVTGLKKETRIIRENIIHEAIARAAGRRKDITRRHITDVEALLDNETGSSINLPYGLTARISYEKLIISALNSESGGIFKTIDAPITRNKIVIPINENENLEIWTEDRDSDMVIIKNDYTKMADYGKIKDTLCIRTPMEGDYIVIDDRGNKKKISRIFIDNKIDREKRASWPVVACGNEIIWAIGLRYSEAFKVDDTTEKVLYMKYQGKGE